MVWFKLYVKIRACLTFIQHPFCMGTQTTVLAIATTSYTTVLTSSMVYVDSAVILQEIGECTHTVLNILIPPDDGS